MDHSVCPEGGQRRRGAGLAQRCEPCSAALSFFACSDSAFRPAIRSTVSLRDPGAGLAKGCEPCSAALSFFAYTDSAFRPAFRSTVAPGS